jgi:hypothetical protein
MMMAHLTGFLEAVNVRDVGMVQRGERLGFASEPRQPLRVTGEGVGQDFQGDITIQLRVAGPKHLAHPAFADRRGDFVAAESGAKGQGQVLDYTAGRFERCPLIRSSRWSASERPHFDFAHSKRAVYR